MKEESKTFQDREKETENIECRRIKGKGNERGKMNSEDERTDNKRQHVTWSEG